MEHLNRQELTRFVLIERADEESSELMRRVNSHILECRACAEKVRRAVAYRAAIDSMAEGSFSLSGMTIPEHEIPSSEVARAAETAEEVKTAYNY